MFGGMLTLRVAKEDYHLQLLTVTDPRTRFRLVTYVVTWRYPCA